MSTPDNSARPYWCYCCQHQFSLSCNSLACPACHAESIQEITPQNDPRKFSIYEQSNSIEEQESIMRISVIVVGPSGMDLGLSRLNNSSLLGGRFQSFFQRLMRALEEEQQEGATQQQIDSLKTAPEVEQCAVCQEQGGSGVLLECGHSFHNSCLMPWLEKKDTCPCCRTRLPTV